MSANCSLPNFKLVCHGSQDFNFFLTYLLYCCIHVAHAQIKAHTVVLEDRTRFYLEDYCRPVSNLYNVFVNSNTSFKCPIKYCSINLNRNFSHFRYSPIITGQAFNRCLNNFAISRNISWIKIRPLCLCHSLKWPTYLADGEDLLVH